MSQNQEKHLQDISVALNHLLSRGSVVEGSRHISCPVKILPSRVHHEQPFSGEIGEIKLWSKAPGAMYLVIGASVSGVGE